MFIEHNRGEQSIVGFIDGDAFVKIARDSSFSTEHEFRVAMFMTSFPELANHFVKPFGLREVYVKNVARIDNESDVLLKPETYCVPRHALHFEYISHAICFDEFIVQQRNHIETVVFPTIRHVLALLRRAQELAGFVHFDLHTGNVLMRPVKTPCEKHIQFANGDSVHIPPLAMEPVIIDYGRAYCNVIHSTFITVELLNTHAGVFSIIPHFAFDFVFFLNSCANQLDEVKYSTLTKRLKPYTAHLVDLGWWQSHESSALEHASNMVRQTAKRSVLFNQGVDQCLVVFSHMCRTTTKIQQDDKKLWTKYFDKFITEWVKFEKFFPSRAFGRLEYFLLYFTTILNGERDNFFASSSRAVAERAIKTALCEYINNETSNKWSDQGINWFELIRCAYLAATMLESILGETTRAQFDRFCKITPSRDQFEIYFKNCF